MYKSYVCIIREKRINTASVKTILARKYFCSPLHALNCPTLSATLAWQVDFETLEVGSVTPLLWLGTSLQSPAYDDLLTSHLSIIWFDIMHNIGQDRNFNLSVALVERSRSPQNRIRIIHWEYCKLHSSQYLYSSHLKDSVEKQTDLILNFFSWFKF